MVLAAGGYPDTVRKGDAIAGLDAAAKLPGKVFHAGTTVEGGEVVTSGGRVLCAVGLGDSVSAAQTQAYALVTQMSGRACSAGAISVIGQSRASGATWKGLTTIETEFAGAEAGRRNMHESDLREQEWQFAADGLESTREWIAASPRNIRNAVSCPAPRWSSRIPTSIPRIGGSFVPDTPCGCGRRARKPGRSAMNSR